MRRSAERLRWWELGLVFALGLGLTSIAMILATVQLRQEVNGSITDRLQAVKSGLAVQLADAYVPTVAGEAFVSTNEFFGTSAGDRPVDDIDSAFRNFAEPINRQLGDILIDYQLAPEGVVLFSANPDRNSAAIGHNILADSSRQSAALDAVVTGSPVVAGPFELLQGGTGLVVRRPIYRDSLASFPERYAERVDTLPEGVWIDSVPDDFWGFATVVVDFESMMRAAGVEQDGERSVSISEAGSPIWGVPRPAFEVIQTTLRLPDGREWQIAATPEQPGFLSVWPIALSGFLLSLGGTWLYMRYVATSRLQKLNHKLGHDLGLCTSVDQMTSVVSVYLNLRLPGSYGELVIFHRDPIRVTWGEERNAKNLEAHAGDLSYMGESKGSVHILGTGTIRIRDFESIANTLEQIFLPALMGRLQREELARLSTRDPLTDLYNRRTLDEKYEALCRFADRESRITSLLLIDVDNFKEVNDSLGHATGDRVLQLVADAMRVCARGGDVSFRIGGDEFALIVVTETVNQAELVGERLATTIAEMRRGASGKIPEFTVSMGLAARPQGYEYSLAQLFSDADTALYNSKSRGRGVLMIYDGVSNYVKAPVGSSRG